MTITRGHLSSSTVFAVFVLLLVAYHGIFGNYFPLANGLMGHDYALTLTSLLDGFLWFSTNGISGIFTPPWFSPSFCGGQPYFSDPQSIFYSVPQFLAFFTSPITAAYTAMLLFAALGFWGMFLFSRRTLNLGVEATLAAACIFMFNGFYADRMIVGHYGYQPFMLVPWVAWLLCLPASSHPRRRHGATVLAVGLLVAYWLQAGLGTLMVPAALAVLVLLCLADLKRSGLLFTALWRGALGGFLALLLCGSKLVASLTLMTHFPRNYYLLPGIGDPEGLARFILHALFYSSEYAYENVTPLWQNMQWAAFPHELGYGVTFIPLVLLLVCTLLRLRTPPQSLAPCRHASFVLLLLIAAIPVALLYYSPEWNAFLKALPIVGSTTSPFRWLIIYVPMVATLTGLAVNHPRFSRLAMLACVIGIPLLSHLENRAYYRLQNYDPKPVMDYYHALKRGETTPHINQVSVPVNENGQQLVDNTRFAQHETPLFCYNPLFGYRQANYRNSDLRPGPVLAEFDSGYLNLRNPACLLYPQENNCRLWDRFRTDQRADVEQFSAYRPFHFEISSSQKWANLTTELALALSVLTAGILIYLTCRDRFRAATGAAHPGSKADLSGIAASVESLPLRIILAVAGTLLLVAIVTLFLPENGLSEQARSYIEQNFVVPAFFFVPEPRERVQYLLTLTAYPVIFLALTIGLRNSGPDTYPGIQPAPSYPPPAPWRFSATWLLPLLALSILFYSRENPFGFSFGFFDYNIVQAVIHSEYPLALFVGASAIFFLAVNSCSPGKDRFSILARKASTSMLWDAVAIGTILVIAARITFVQENIGANEWSPSLVHFSPLFEPAARSYLGAGTAGVDMISQYGGLVEFGGVVLALFGGDPIGAFWFAYLSLALACLCQWAAVRRFAGGNRLLAWLSVGAILYLTNIKLQGFTCFQCVNFRWFWPSLFIFLAALNTPARFGWLPYFLFPFAIFWSPETGLASLAAWVGWRSIVWLVGATRTADRLAALRLAVTSVRRPLLALASGLACILLYLYLKSGKLPDFSILFQYAKDFYIFGFYMIPMPGLHLWNVYALVAAVLFSLGVMKLLEAEQAKASQKADSLRARYGFIVFSTLLFGLLFAYFQGRSYYGNLLTISYPLWAAMLVWLGDKVPASGRESSLKDFVLQHPSRTLLVVVLSFAATATYTTPFNLSPMQSPFELADRQGKAELAAYIEANREGKKPLIISFNSWRLMLLSNSAPGNAIAPLAAILRRSQLDEYLAEVKKGEYAVFYDRSTDVFFQKERTPWADEMLAALKKSFDLENIRPADAFDNDQAHLVKLRSRAVH